MTFKDIRNNERNIEILGRMIASGEVPHAFLMEAPAYVDKMAFALSFAKALLCESEPGIGCGVCSVCRKIDGGNHIDVTVVQATGSENTKATSVKDKDVAFLQERLSKKPVEGDRNIAIIGDADTMTPRALNHLLKTLEEPASGTVIMLLSENADSLPATIRSRCTRMRIRPFEGRETGEVLRDAGVFCRLVEEGEQYLATRDLLKNYTKEKSTALKFLDAVEEHLGQGLPEHRAPLQRERSYRRIEAVEAARDEIRRGANLQRALNKLAIIMGETK